MGYRSEIALVIEFDTDENAQGYLNTYDKKKTFDLIFKIRKNILVFHEEDLKWYDGYRDVDYIESFYDQSENALGYVSRAKARIGEDYSDIEQEFHGDRGFDLLDIERSIYIPREEDFS